VPTIELLNELQRRHEALSRPPLRAAIVGPPCAGKYVQADAIRRAYAVCRITRDDLVDPEKGGSVGDQPAMSTLKSILEQPQCRRGYILQGFPSTTAEAERLKRSLEQQKVPLEHVVFLEAEEEALLERNKGRHIHDASGRRYHEVSKPPIEAGKDDYTGEPLSRRSLEEADFQKALSEYRDAYRPLHKFFDKLGLARQVDASGKAEEVGKAVAESLRPS